jgi:hypothetical protein
MHKWFWWENMKKTDNLGRLRCKWENNITGREWTGFSGLRAWNTGRFL